jgi:RHS repeat-associated protein
MSAVISRHHDDYRAGETTGALDTNADSDELKYTAANLEGRIQITANWYDDFGSVTDTVRYGTYGGSDFDRDGLSVPARSDTALLTENAFNTDGSLKSMTDPMDRETRYEYDDAGRRTAVIRNYVDGTPSGDTDHYTRFTYVDGLQTELWVDLDGDDTQDTDDQVTAYRYGTTKGASAGDSKIETGHLLYKVVYPDVETGETEADHRVLYAYNAQSQRIWTKDQEANVLETDFDDGGRVEHTRVTTLDAAFDDDVLRIARAYDSLGRVSTVTQYDHATVGSGSVVDEVKYTYDDWGPVSKFQQDHDSAIGGTQLRDIDYTYEKATSGRNTIRRTTMDLPDGTTLTYEYLDDSSLHDDEASRVTRIKIEASPSDTAIAWYDYNGVGQVVGIDDLEVDVMSQQYGSTSGSYPDLDRFDRVTSSRWTKDLATDRDFYDLDITYDRNSNITLVEDNVFDGFDVEYTIDGQDRLSNAEEGTWNGSSITSTTREQIWTLDQLGNWDQVQLDLDGSGTFTGTDEYDDDRTHNDFNELIGRDTDDNGTDDHTLVYNKLGQLTDDDEHYEYEYDAFGRLRFVKDTDDQSVVSEYTYNGLGYRVGVHQDTDTDGDVDANDAWRRNVYDDRWRIVGVYENSLAYWDELFVHHNAGADGLGGSSYIDTLILRERDTNYDGTLDERIYYCQNWRADVVTLIDSAGEALEHPRYSPYGVPNALPAGDVDETHKTDGSDVSTVDGWVSQQLYKVKADLDLDGDVDIADSSAVSGKSGDQLGWKTLSLAGIASRASYAGYELDDALVDARPLMQVRNRAMIADVGRWNTRDPLGGVDRVSVYEYVKSTPTTLIDPLGLASREIDRSPYTWHDPHLPDWHCSNWIDCIREWFDAGSPEGGCCSAQDCTWDGTITWHTYHVVVWGANTANNAFSVNVTGTDSTGCLYRVKAGAPLMHTSGVAILLGNYKHAEHFEDYPASCMWPVEQLDQGAFTMNALGVSAANIAQVVTTAGECECWGIGGVPGWWQISVGTLIGLSEPFANGYYQAKGPYAPPGPCVPWRLNRLPAN